MKTTAFISLRFLLVSCLFGLLFSLGYGQYHQGFLQKHPDRDLPVHAVGFNAGLVWSISKITYIDGVVGQGGGQVTHFFTEKIPGAHLGLSYRYRMTPGIVFRFNPSFAFTGYTRGDTLWATENPPSPIGSPQIWLPAHMIFQWQLPNSAPYLILGGAFHKTLPMKAPAVSPFTDQDFAFEAGLGWDVYTGKMVMGNEFVYSVGLTDQMSNPAPGVGAIHAMFQHSIRWSIGFH